MTADIFDTVTFEEVKRKLLIKIERRKTKMTNKYKIGRGNALCNTPPAMADQNGLRAGVRGANKGLMMHSKP